MHFNASCLGKRLQIFRTRYFDCSPCKTATAILKDVVSLARRLETFYKERNDRRKKSKHFCSIQTKEVTLLTMFIFLACASEETNCFSYGWFPVSRIFYVRYVRNGNAWKGACKRKSWTSLNFSFKLSIFYLSSILFTWLKFTCVNERSQTCASGNQPYGWTLYVPI